MNQCGCIRPSKFFIHDNSNRKNAFNFSPNNREQKIADYRRRLTINGKHTGFKTMPNLDVLKQIQYNVQSYCFSVYIISSEILIVIFCDEKLREISSKILHLCCMCKWSVMEIFLSPKLVVSKSCSRLLFSKLVHSQHLGGGGG